MLSMGKPQATRSQEQENLIQPTRTQNLENESMSKLKVGIAGDPPGVFRINGQNENISPTGIIVTIWDFLATKLELEYNLIYYESVSEVLKDVENELLDVAIGDITITDEGIARIDFTQPMATDSLTLLVPKQTPGPWRIVRPFLGRAFVSSVGLIILNIFIVGNLLWLAEHKKNSQHFPRTYFRGVFVGMWLALVTFTTVGYGDRYPITPLGRSIAGVWMLISLAVITTLTAGIASAFAVAFSAKPYAGINQPEDVKNIRIAAIDNSASVQWAEHYQARVIPVDHVDEAIGLLESKQVEGFIFNRLSLEYYLHKNPQKSFAIVDFNLGTQSYGFALSQDNPLTRRLNREIASVEVQIYLNQVAENWLDLDRHENSNLNKQNLLD